VYNVPDVHSTGSNPSQVIGHCYTYLEGHMDADSVSHMMHNKHLITDSDNETVTAATCDIKMIVCHCSVLEQ